MPTACLDKLQNHIHPEISIEMKRLSITHLTIAITISTLTFLGAPMDAIAQRKPLPNFPPNKIIFKPFLNRGTSGGMEISASESGTGQPSAVSGNKVTYSGCELTPIRYQRSSQEISLVGSASYLSIYPGLITTTDEILGGTYGDFVSGGGQRNPMSMTTTITSEGGRKSIDVRPNQFDNGSIRALIDDQLLGSLGGRAPTINEKSLTVVQSMDQFIADNQSMSSSSVATDIGVGVPNIPVSVSASNTVTIDNAKLSSFQSQEQKSQIVLKVKSILYEVTMTKKSDASGVLLNNLYSNKPNSSLPSNLVYVNKVSYGFVYYLTITSAASKKDLLETVSNSIGTSTKVGTAFPVNAATVEAEVGVTTNNSSISAERMQSIKDQWSVNVFQFGGEGINDLGTLGNNPAEGLGTLLDKLNDLGIVTATNIPAPISFTIARPESQTLFINYDARYGTASCSSTADKVKLELILEDFDVKHSADLVSSAEYYGSIWAKNIRTNNKTKGDVRMWDVPRWKADSDGRMYEGIKFTAISGGVPRFTLFDNLSMAEAKKVAFDLVVTLADSDSVDPDDVFRMTNSDTKSGHSYTRTGRMSWPSTSASIDQLQKGESIDLKIGDDNYMTCDMKVQDNDPDKGHTVIRFRVRATGK